MLNFREEGEFGDGATMVATPKDKPRLVKYCGCWRVFWRGRYHGNGSDHDDPWLCYLVTALPKLEGNR